MTILGRTKYEKIWCVHCKAKKKTWTEDHNNNNATENFPVVFPLSSNKDLDVADIKKRIK